MCVCWNKQIVMTLSTPTTTTLYHHHFSANWLFIFTHQSLSFHNNNSVCISIQRRWCPSLSGSTCNTQPNGVEASSSWSGSLFHPKYRLWSRHASSLHWRWTRARAWAVFWHLRNIAIISIREPVYKIVG